MSLLGLLSGERSATVRTIEMCNVFPDRIRSRTVRTLTIAESRQTLRSGAQLRIHSKETFIGRLHPSFCSVSSSSSLSLPLLDRLTEILPPLIQELCLPIGLGCLFYGHPQKAWFEQMRLCKCLPHRDRIRTETQSSFRPDGAPLRSKAKNGWCG